MADATAKGAEELTVWMERVLDSLPTNVFLCDSDLKIVAINACAWRGLRRMNADIRAAFGVDVEQMIGTPMHRFFGDPERIAAIIGDPSLLPHATELVFGPKTFAVRIDALRLSGGAVSGYAVVCEDVSRQRAAEQVLRTTLRQRAALLREVHHRVRGVLRLVAGLVRLESGAGAGSEEEPAWAERLSALARVHERIYSSDDVSHVNLDVYVSGLVREIAAAHSASAKIKIETAVHAEIQDIDRLIVFGMVLHELVANAVEHGFPDGRAGRVRVTARAVDGVVEAVVSDDGVGLPAGEAKRSGLGLKLVCALIEERLGGSWKIESRGGGLACLFTFPAEAQGKS